MIDFLHDSVRYRSVLVIDRRCVVSKRVAVAKTTSIVARRALVAKPNWRPAGELVITHDPGCGI